MKWPDPRLPDSPLNPSGEKFHLVTDVCWVDWQKREKRESRGQTSYMYSLCAIEGGVSSWTESAAFCHKKGTGNLAAFRAPSERELQQKFALFKPQGTKTGGEFLESHLNSEKILAVCTESGTG